MKKGKQENIGKRRRRDGNIGSKTVASFPKQCKDVDIIYFWEIKWDIICEIDMFPIGIMKSEQKDHINFYFDWFMMSVSHLKVKLNDTEWAQIMVNIFHYYYSLVILCGWNLLHFPYLFIFAQMRHSTMSGITIKKMTY